MSRSYDNFRRISRIIPQSCPKTNLLDDDELKWSYTQNINFFQKYYFGYILSKFSLEWNSGDLEVVLKCTKGGRTWRFFPRIILNDLENFYICLNIQTLKNWFFFYKTTLTTSRPWKLQNRKNDLQKFGKSVTWVFLLQIFSCINHSFECLIKQLLDLAYA